MNRRYQKFFALGLFLAVLSLGFSHDAAAQKRVPDATASITLTSLSFIGGIEWGKGELHFKGKNYTFKGRVSRRVLLVSSVTRFTRRFST